MILFAKDFLKYPSAIIDYETSNQSFVELARLYRDMGVKNHLFCLSLINPQLKGVDPFSENLTQTQKLMIGVEVSMNPWYYLREILRAPARSGADPVPISANRSIVGLYWAFLNHIQVFLIQPRQTGKSFGTDSLMNWLLYFKCMNTEINLLTKDDTLRTNNIERLRSIADDFPPYLKFRTKQDSNNLETITVKARGNIYKTHVPQTSPKNAIKLGRGLTTAIFHSDEGPFCSNIAISIPAAFAAMGAAIEEAKRNNAPYGQIFTTTAGRKDDRDGRYIYNLLREAAIWDERIFFDCKDQEDLERTIRKLSNTDKVKRPSGVYRVNMTFSHRQLGKSDEWLKIRLEEALSEGDDANRDFFNIWTSGTETSPFSVEVTERLASSRRDPVCRVVSDIGQYITNWYIEEDKIEDYMLNNQVIIALDASENIGRDDTTLHFINTENLETVATGVYNDTNVYTIAEHILNLMIKYPKTVLIPEAKNMGTAIINFLLLKLPLHGFDPFKRIFNRVVQEYLDRPEAYDEIRRYGRTPDVINRHKALFGYSTAGSGEYSRDKLYSQPLSIATKKAAERVYDNTLLNQLLTLTIRNNRIDHEVGGHDDMVIAWLLNVWFLTNGKNLSYYGLNHARIMNQIQSKPKKEMTIEEYEEELYQQELRREINRIVKEMSETSDQNLHLHLEYTLRHLSGKLVLKEHETYSVDVLINQIRERRKKFYYAN